jgi:hypothetical protein
MGPSVSSCREAARIPLHDIKLSQRVLMAGAGTLFITAVSTLMVGRRRLTLSNPS